MRPIPENSTDILYSAFALEEMRHAGEALGISNINVITTACLKPRRVLYHSCVNNVQARLKNDSWDESVQGRIIADRADHIYGLTEKEFEQALAASQPGMGQKYTMVAEFMTRLAGEEKLSWDCDSFQERWPIGDTERFPYRWQRKAIETYQKIKENMAQGIYKPENGWDAIQATRWWSDRNLEYKHYRDISRRLVNQKLDEHFPPQDFLEQKPTRDRTTLLIVSGMGGGKSWFSRAYLESLPEAERRNIILHDADYMKLAFARSAMRDGVITQYTGPEVQNESSNCLYENTIKRKYFTRTRGAAPDVIVNSTVAGSYEIEDGLEGNGKVVIHHISIDPEDAVKATEARARVIGRKPEPESVRRSCRVSTQSMLNLFTHYAGKPITVHLYERSAGTPQSFGIIDIQGKCVTINDTAAFLRFCERAQLHDKKQEAQKSYIESLLGSGATIICTAPQYLSRIHWSLSPDATLSINPALQEAPGVQATAVGQLAKKISVGNITFSPSAKTLSLQ